MRSFGSTDIITSENSEYRVRYFMIIKRSYLFWSKLVTDINGNQIYLNMFDYSIEKMFSHKEILRY